MHPHRRALIAVDIDKKYISYNCGVQERVCRHFQVALEGDAGRSVIEKELERTMANAEESGGPKAEEEGGPELPEEEVDTRAGGLIRRPIVPSAADRL